MVERAHPVDSRVLIVDDEEVNVRLLERIFVQAGYRNVLSTTDSLRDEPSSERLSTHTNG